MCKTDGTFQDHPQELQKLALALLTSRVPAEWEEYWISPSVFTWFDGMYFVPSPIPVAHCVLKTCTPRRTDPFGGCAV